VVGPVSLMSLAYLLKEQFRLVFQLRGKVAIRALDDWCAWARRCRIPAFVDLYYRVMRHRESTSSPRSLTTDCPTRWSSRPTPSCHC
jgi:hypothetical protein